MAIVGIETINYAVKDLEEATRYFIDFGLPLLEQSDTHTHFRMDEGSNVILRHIDDPLIPKSKLEGYGVHETIWGVDRQDELDKLVEGLSTDREVSVDSEGTARFHDDTGIAHGLRLFTKKPVYSAPDPVNSPGNINRINQQRKWKVKARPKTIQHVVFVMPDVNIGYEFFRDRLNFRLSDIQEHLGIFCRADGANDHHNIYFLNSNAPFPGMNGQVGFDHVNYGVEDIDEMMIGANYMERQGWPKSIWGLGRHRIASSAFMYLPCPAGGQAEYGADSDYIDDSWVPRIWNPLHGFFSFITNLQPWAFEAAPWEWRYVKGYTPEKKEESE